MPVPEGALASEIEANVRVVTAKLAGFHKPCPFPGREREVVPAAAEDDEGAITGGGDDWVKLESIQTLFPFPGRWTASGISPITMGGSALPSVHSVKPAPGRDTAATVGDCVLEIQRLWPCPGKWRLAAEASMAVLVVRFENYGRRGGYVARAFR
ncbi:MAG: hypothetical protein ACI8T1_003133 [Verrucomicrobiales bacterium]|jgi:hypothetical protein